METPNSHNGSLTRHHEKLLVSKPASRPTHVRYYVLAAICLATVINYIQRNSVAGMVPLIKQSLGTNADYIFYSTSGFFVAYALMQIPSGWLAQVWGPRRALTVFAIGWSLATAAMGQVPGIREFAVARTLMGAIQAGIFPCATLIMVAWLPASRRGLASALLNSCMLIGGGAVSNLNSELLLRLDWRSLLGVYSIPGFVWAVWFFVWFRDRPGEKLSVNQAERDLISADAGLQSRKSATFRIAILASIPLWLICLQQAMRAGAMRFVDQCLPTYLQDVPLAGMPDEKIRLSFANYLTAFPQYIGIVSGPIGGFLSDWVLRRTGRRRLARNGVAISSMGISTLCFLPIFFTSDAVSQVFLLTVGTFVSTCAAPCAYALTMDVGGSDLPIVFGAMNMMGNFGAAAITGLVPPINRWTGGSWHASLVLFVGIHVVALVCWLLLDPNRPIGLDEQSHGAERKE